MSPDRSQSHPMFTKCWNMLSKLLSSSAKNRYSAWNFSFC